MRIKGIYVGGGKGATAYELQIHRMYLRVTHLMGGYFTMWAFWRRFSCKLLTNPSSY